MDTGFALSAFPTARAAPGFPTAAAISPYVRVSPGGIDRVASRTWRSNSVNPVRFSGIRERSTISPPRYAAICLATGPLGPVGAAFSRHLTARQRPPAPPPSPPARRAPGAARARASRAFFEHRLHRWVDGDGGTAYAGYHDELRA